MSFCKCNTRISPQGHHDKMPQSVWFKQQEFIAHSLDGAWKSMPTVLGLERAAFLLCLHVVLALCACTGGVSACPRRIRPIL